MPTRPRKVIKPGQEAGFLGIPGGAPHLLHLGLPLGHLGGLDILHRGRFWRHHGWRGPYHHFRPGRLCQGLWRRSPGQQTDHRLHPGFQPMAGGIEQRDLLFELLPHGPLGAAPGGLPGHRRSGRLLADPRADRWQGFPQGLPGVLRHHRLGAGHLPYLRNDSQGSSRQESSQGGRGGL